MDMMQTQYWEGIKMFLKSANKNIVLANDAILIPLVWMFSCLSDYKSCINRYFEMSIASTHLHN